MYLVCKVSKKRCIFCCAIPLLLLLGLLLWNTLPSARPAASLSSEIAACREMLQHFGWETDSAPNSREEFILDTALSEDFLALQRESGFDLKPILGKDVTRYTFRVLNYPTGESDVVADLLVREGQVVGGDIRSTALSGFIHSLDH